LRPSGAAIAHPRDQLRSLAVAVANEREQPRVVRELRGVQQQRQVRRPQPAARYPAATVPWWICNRSA
jgi:hypothetical protein